MSVLMDHIHLSTTLGGAENAPTMRWKVRSDGYVPTLTLYSSVERTLSGKLSKQVLRSAGAPVVFEDFKFILAVYAYDGMTLQERRDALKDMLGKQVYFCDVWHIYNGVDHTPYVKTMFLESISDIGNIDPLLQRMYYSVELRDDFTV